MIGIVVVVYKSYERIVTYVRQELTKISAPHRTVIVDVGSPREASERIAQALGVSVWQEGMAADGELFVLHSDENLGYARGNNLGADFLMRLFPDIDKLLFSNDDIELISPNVVEVLAAHMDDDASIGCIGPKVIDLKGNLQGPGYAPPSLRHKVVQNLGEPLLGAAPFRLDVERERKSEPVNIVGGCFHLVRADAFRRLGGFDPRTFLYWEEEILSARLRSLELCVYFEADVAVRHFVGNTTSASAPNLLLLTCELTGQRLYFREYAKVSKAAYALLWLSGEVRLFLVHLAMLKRWILRKNRKAV